MRKKAFISFFVFGICILFLTSGKSQEISGSNGYSIPETANSGAYSGNNSGNGEMYFILTQSTPGGRADPDAANWNISALDTAAGADYLSPDEKDVILEMNKVRADPKKYAELYIKPVLEYNWGGPFGANSYLAPGETVYTGTSEGKNGIQSCINDLSKRQGMSPLLLEKGLFLAARDHANDTGPKGILGHDGSDGSSMGQRINRYGRWDVGSGENISYGHKKGRDIVVQLLIDDGVSSRGHRNNILNKNFKYTGAALGRHSKYGYLCVIDYANEYKSK